jgi:hypothetical protein
MLAKGNIMNFKKKETLIQLKHLLNKVTKKLKKK